MRKWLLFPLLIPILACGGGSLGSSNTFSFPNTRNVNIEFHNTTAVAVKMWTEPDETEPAGSLGTNDNRTASVSRTWDNETTNHVFTFKAREGANPISTVTLSINGQESHAQNFSGFLVEWKTNPANGSRYLSAETQ